METLTIKDAQQKVDQWIKTIGVRYFNELMADVLWVLICLANQTGVNLTEAFHKNLDKKTGRDFNRHQNNEKLK